MSSHGLGSRTGLAAVLLTAALCSVPAHAQGCSACRDTTAGSAPQVRRGLRRAIIVLGTPAAAFFLGMIGVAYRIERRRGGQRGPVT